MSSKKKWVPLGKVLREWGVKGQVRCVSFNPSSTLFSDLKKIYIEVSGDYHAMEIHQAKRHGKDWLIKFSEYENPETARELRSVSLWLPREDLPPPEPGEIYLSDLEGLKVFDEAGKELGEVQGFQRVGESEVLKVGMDPKKTFLIPYESDFIKSTSLEQGKIILKDGAKDLYDPAI